MTFRHETAEGSRIAVQESPPSGAGEAACVPRTRLPDEIGAFVTDGGADGRALLPAGTAVSGMGVSSQTAPGAPASGALLGWPTTTELAARLARVEAELASIRAALQARELAPHPAHRSRAQVPTAKRAAPRGESTEADKARGGAAPAPRKNKGNTKPKKWTPERKALLVKMKTERVPAPLILEALNKRRGEPITLQAMHAYANTALLLRTEGPAPRLTPVWNEARLAHLRVAWARGDTTEQIFADLNAIPGMKPIEKPSAVFARAHNLGVTRSAEGAKIARERGAQKVRGIGLVWNEAMNALLRKHYPNKAKALAEIAAEITAIAPRPISVEAVQQHAHYLRVFRPTGPVIGTVIKPRKKPAAPTPPRRRSPAPKVSAARPKPASAEAKIAKPAIPAASVSAKGDDCAQPKPVADGAPPAKNLSEGKLGPGGARVDIIAAPQVEGELPPYDPTAKGSVETRVAKAREMLRKGTDEHIVQMQTRIALREVYRLAGEIRRERAA